MQLRDSLKPECIETGQVFESKDAALAAIARIAKRCPDLAAVSEEELLSALREREKAGSTGVGDGVALPHCRLSKVTSFVVGMVTLKEPLEFRSADDRPVRLLAFIIAPAEMSESHVVLLSQLSQVLVGKHAVDKLVSAVDPTGLYRHIMAATSGGTVTAKENWPASLFQISLTNEDLLYELLPIFSAVPGCQAMVTDALKSTSFLKHMPLFSSFWTSRSNDELKIITAVVPKKMTNEVIRQVDQATGGIADRDDALLIVQDLFFCSGNLY
ncbi:MAG: PTS sugar transporter subunit IIA [Lentisphaeria bacterium]|nr:PTS sugar transporter subunit IIA [Lentisphaeria bacterium]